MSFKSHTAHRAIADRLHRSLQHGRLAHAYLFAGPRGSGREELAVTLAQALNCERADDDACGQCRSCRQIAERTHPDVYWLRPEKKSRRISVEAMRDFERGFALAPREGRMKVGLVVDADCLNDSSANAFLKTLEEPPPRTVLILLTTEPQRLLPTIISRCLRVSFGRAGTTHSAYRPSVVELLATFTRDRAQGIVAAYRLLAGLTQLLQRVRADVEQQFAAQQEAIDDADIEAEAREKLEEQLTANQEGEYRARREEVMEEIYSWHSDIVLCVAHAEPALLEHPDQADLLRHAAANSDHARAVAALEAVEQIREAFARNVNEAFALEVGLLKLALQQSPTQPASVNR